MKKGIIGTMALAVGGMVGAIVTGKAMNRRVNGEHKLAEKHLGIMRVFDQWVAIKQEGKNLASYFEKNGYKRIAIYGMSFLGERLLNELRNSEIQVAYGIDRNANAIYSEIEIKTLEEELEPVDVIVVTAISFFDEIEYELEKKVDCPIISIEDVLYDM